MSKFSWVTLVTNDTYSLGALVLAHSLKRVSTAHQLAVLITSGVSEDMKKQLKEVYNVLLEVNVLDSKDSANLALLSRPELGVTFTKLNCWRLLQFEKCVFLDADTLILQNCDELFDREELSAAPDVSWPDCFNSGVFVFRPSLDTYESITEFAVKYGSFDGGDQGLLNQYFSDWSRKDITKHLPFIYNTTAYASYCYLPAFKQFRDNIKILHFAGKLKPWSVTFDSESKTVHTPTEYEHAADLIQLWWNIFCEKVHQQLSVQMAPYIVEHKIVHAHQQLIKIESKESLLDDTKTPHIFFDPWEDYYEQLQDKFLQDASEIVEEIPSISEEQALMTGEDNEKCSYGKYHISTEVIGASDNNSNEYNSVCDSRLKETSAEVLRIDSEENLSITTDNCMEKLSDFVLVESFNSQNAEISHNDEISLLIVTSIAKEEAGLAGALSSLRLGEKSPEQEAYDLHMRRQCWESGNIDYSGRDSFDNIWKRISDTMETKPTTTCQQSIDNSAQLEMKSKDTTNK